MKRRATYKAAMIASAAIGAGFGLGLTTGAVAMQSLKDARERDAAMADLVEQARYTGRICGAKLRVEIDWKSAGDWQAGLLVSECDGALGALEAACRGGDERARNVKKFVCAGDGRGAKLSGSTLRYGASSRFNAFRETQSALSGD